MLAQKNPAARVDGQEARPVLHKRFMLASAVALAQRVCSCVPDRSSRSENAQHGVIYARHAEQTVFEPLAQSSQVFLNVHNHMRRKAVGRDRAKGCVTSSTVFPVARQIAALPGLRGR